MTSSSDPISVTIYGEKPLVFNYKDVERLRCEHRIIGALIGTLPRYPLQNTYLGLPLLLMPEELTLLLSKGIATLSDGSSWSFPQTSIERARCRVFRQLWEQQWYITCGTKFGGDYLVYTDDPMQCHSQYIVSVRDRQDTIKPLELIAAGRLATNSRKVFVFAEAPDSDDTSDENDKAVHGFAVQWAGF